MSIGIYEDIRVDAVEAGIMNDAQTHQHAMMMVVSLFAYKSILVKTHSLMLIFSFLPVSYIGGFV
jgi:hypothetical protein